MSYSLYMKQPETVLKATRPYFEALAENPSYQPLVVLGGVAVAALASPATKIDTKRHEIIALASDADSPRIRENGSIRDLDIYVPASDKEVLNGVYRNIEEVVGKDVLEISVFGNQPFLSLKNQRMLMIKTVRKWQCPYCTQRRILRITCLALLVACAKKTMGQRSFRGLLTTF